MPLRICDRATCQHPVERHTGSCMICDQHLCFEHTKAVLHTCPREEDDADAYFEAYAAAKTRHEDALIGKINLAALQKVASDLRNNIPCAFTVLGTDGFIDRSVMTSQMGGQNLHVDIVFEDGVTWIARLRLDDPMIAPPITRDLIAESEVATLKFLSNTKVPTPAVHHYTLSSTLDDVGVPYMLIDKLKGKPLDWYSLDQPSKSKVLTQLANIFIELSQLPFPKTGSLISSNNSLNIASFTILPLFQHPNHSLGPFHSTNAAAKTIIELHLEMYASGERSDYPIDSFLALLYRKSIIDEIYPHTNNNNNQSNSFFLNHTDDKGDHILIDSEANITGIIDWEYASIECEEHAFSTPCMLWPVGDYYDGKNELSAEEIEFSDILERKGHKRLAEIVLNSRIHQRFWFFLSGAPYDYDEFVSLFDGLRKAYTTYSSKTGNDDVEPYNEWREAALVKYKDSEPRLQMLLDRTIT